MIQSYKCNQQLRNAHLDFTETKWKTKKQWRQHVALGMLIFKILTNRRKLQLVSYQNERLDFRLCLIHFYISYSNWDGLWTVFTKQAFSQFAFTYVTRCAAMEWKQEKTEGSRKSTVCSGLVTENRVEPSNTLIKTIQFERYPFSPLIRILLSKQKCEQ